jgi:hypothetical protein
LKTILFLNARISSAYGQTDHGAGPEMSLFSAVLIGDFKDNDSRLQKKSSGTI